MTFLRRFYGIYNYPDSMKETLLLIAISLTLGFNVFKLPTNF
ncbi:hypothetical protein ACVWYG_003847 [Pedobacter sp. UYEF25]